MKKLNEMQTTQITGGGMESWFIYNGTQQQKDFVCSGIYAFLVGTDPYFYQIAMQTYWEDFGACGLTGDDY